MYNTNILDHLSRSYANGQFSLEDSNRINNILTEEPGQPLIRNNFSTDNYARAQQRNFDLFSGNMLKESFGNSSGYDMTYNGDYNNGNYNVGRNIINEKALNFAEEQNTPGKAIVDNNNHGTLNNQAKINYLNPPNYSSPKFDNSKLVVRQDYIEKQNTILFAAIAVIGFILYMLFQLYMGQRKIEYLLALKRMEKNYREPVNRNVSDYM